MSLPPGTKGVPLDGSIQRLADLAGAGLNLLQGDLPMPVAVLKRSAVDNNLSVMQTYIERAGLKLAPHAKTTMCPQLFARQLSHGSWGLSVATMAQLQLCHEMGVARLTLANLLDIATKPAWALRMLASPHKNFGNLAGSVPGGKGLTTLSQWIAGQFDPTLSWKDVAWVRSLWPGKLIVKGILDPEDARAAVDSGADAIVVSNHGGRQLDGAPSSISALPDIVDAVGQRTEVLFDSGVRTRVGPLRDVSLAAALQGPEPKPGELTLPRILSTVVDAYGVEQVRDGQLVVRLEKARRGR